VDKGNTVIVVEHNLDVIKVADYIIDLGPGGGEYGGKLIASGTPEKIIKNKKSLTGQFLKKELENQKVYVN
jgi:excinuclease ABC subunit A